MVLRWRASRAGAPLKTKTKTQKQLFLYLYKIKFNVSEGNFYKTKYGVGTEGRQAKRSVVNDHNE